MADVFISYAREDQGRAGQIAQALQAQGLDIFWDNEIPPGHTWADYIEGKLSACRAVIVLWSQHSTKSQWVREEARMGRDKAKLIPAMIDGTQAPFGFGEVQAADLTNWNGDPNHPEWVRFSNAVRHFAGQGGAAPPPPAPQPQAQAQSGWSAPPPQAPQGGGWSTPNPQQASWSQAGGQGAQSGAAETLSPIGYVQKCLRLYANGKGRARRAEFWWWLAFAIVVAIVAGIVDMMFGVNPYTMQPNSQIVSTISSLALLAPGVSVAARRLHDIGMNGWLAAPLFIVGGLGGGLAALGNPLGLILSLAAFAGWIFIGASPGKPGTNEYGPNPKGV